MTIYEKRLDEIEPFKNNPRINKDAVDAVAASIKEFGFKQPLVIDKDGIIVVGHTRYKAAKKLKLETVPCVLADDLNEEQIKAYRLADNKTNELSGWDEKLLAAELNGIPNIDMSAFGFDVKYKTDNNLISSSEENYEEDLDDIEKLEKHYGVPYQGNKSRIADLIISVLPKGNRLVDLFGGGGGDNALCHVK